MTKGKKELFGQRGSRDFRILYAVFIGVALGACWAYLRPRGGFATSPLVFDRRSTKVSYPKMLCGLQDCSFEAFSVERKDAIERF